MLHTNVDDMCARQLQLNNKRPWTWEILVRHWRNWNEKTEENDVNPKPLKYFLNNDVFRSYKQDINLRNMEKRIHTEKQSIF